MGRKSQITKEQVVEVYNKADSVRELAGLLSRSVTAVYYMLKRHNLKPYPYEPLLSKLPYTLAARYKERTTIQQLAFQFNMKAPTARYHLLKFILYSNRYSLSAGLPKPKTIGDIKIINTLKTEPKASFAFIKSRTGLTDSSIHRYLERLKHDK